MKGKYRKRRHARIMREGGTIALAERPNVSNATGDLALSMIDRMRFDGAVQEARKMTVSDLRAIANGLGATVTTRTHKADLINTIIDLGWRP